jgi:hypothetical protein
MLRHFFLPACFFFVAAICFCKLAYFEAGLRAVCCRLVTMMITLPAILSCCGRPDRMMLGEKQQLGQEATMAYATRDFFDTLAKVLIRCWLLGTLLLLFSFVVFMLTGEIIDDIHGRWFGVTPHELDLIIYCGMGLHKLVVNLFFLFPWLAIRWVLWKDKAKAA